MAQLQTLYLIPVCQSGLCLLCETVWKCRGGSCWERVDASSATTLQGQHEKHLLKRLNEGRESTHSFGRRGEELLLTFDPLAASHYQEPRVTWKSKLSRCLWAEPVPTSLFRKKRKRRRLLLKAHMLNPATERYEDLKSSNNNVYSTIDMWYDVFYQHLDSDISVKTVRMTEYKKKKMYKQVTSLCHHIEMLYSYFITVHLNAT